MVDNIVFLEYPLSSGRTRSEVTTKACMPAETSAKVENAMDIPTPLAAAFLRERMKALRVYFVRAREIEKTLPEGKQDAFYDLTTKLHLAWLMKETGAISVEEFARGLRSVTKNPSTDPEALLEDILPLIAAALT